MKEIMITGTGTQYDGKSVAAPDDQYVWSVIKPPKVTDWLFNDPQAEVDFERLDCTFTGVVFEKDGHRAEIWAPLHQHEEVIRQAEEASKLFPGIKAPPKPKSEPKPDPIAVVSLESELDGDEWDLDSED